MRVRLFKAPLAALEPTTTMSTDKRNSGAAANGFLPRTLLKEEASALHDNHYPVPPDMRAPGV